MSKTFVDTLRQSLAKLDTFADPWKRPVHPLVDRMRSYFAPGSFAGRPSTFVLINHASDWLYNTPASEHPYTMAQWAQWICSPSRSFIWRAAAWDNPCIPVQWWHALCCASGIPMEHNDAQKHETAVRVFASAWNDKYIDRGSLSPMYHLQNLCEHANGGRYGVDNTDLLQHVKQLFPFCDVPHSNAELKDFVTANPQFKTFRRASAGAHQSDMRYSLATYTEQVHPFSWDVDVHNQSAIEQMFALPQIPDKWWPHIPGMLATLDYYRKPFWFELPIHAFERLMAHLGLASIDELRMHTAILEKDTPWITRVRLLCDMLDNTSVNRQEMPGSSEDLFG